VVAAVLLGAVAAFGLGLQVLGLGVGLALFVWLLQFNPGALIAVLLIAQLGGIPGLRLTNGQETLVLIVQIAVMVWVIALPSRERRGATALESATYLGCALYLAWWILVALKTTVLEGGSATAALAAARDLAYIPILLPLALVAMRSAWNRKGFLVAMGIGTAVFLVLRVLYGLGFSAAGHLIISQRLSELGGVTRVFSSMNYPMVAAVALGVAAALRGQTPRIRAVGWAFALMGSAAVVLQLTRAIYIGLGAGILIAIVAWYLQGSGPGQTAFRRRAMTLVGGVAVVTCVVLLWGPGTGGSGKASAVSERLDEGVTNIAEGTGTVGIRESAARAILQTVGNDWPTGMGFWLPSERYFSGVRQGDLRDTDLGIVNLIATEGALGVALLYLPLLFLLARLLISPTMLRGRRAPPYRPESEREEGDAGWLLLGFSIWLASILVSSITLGNFFTRPGCAFTGTVLGLVIAVNSAITESAPASRRVAALVPTAPLGLRSPHVA
jgi:hypothetical protein